MKIFTPYGEKPPREPQEPGNRMQPHYRQKYDENGHSYLVKDGETDVYAIIQSHKDECDINALLARYAAGDMGVIHPGAIYADISNIPENIIDMINIINANREKFDALPAKVKELFGNSYERWAAAAGTEDWLQKMGLVQNASGDSLIRANTTDQNRQNDEKGGNE